MSRVINFYAGPAGLPLPALEKAQRELLDFGGAGMSVMEISHRAKEYDAVHQGALDLVRALLSVPDNYKILLLQGGGNLQFGMVPMNLLHGGRKADYIDTGNWAKSAIKEAKIVAPDAVRVAASTASQSYTRLPRPDEIEIGPDSAYLHFCSNNTIEGTQFQEWPDSGGAPLVCDMSSDIMWRPFDLKPFGLVYAGAQKNMGPSGVTLVIIRDDMLAQCRTDLTSYLRYTVHAEANSLYNTPPAFGIYILRNVLEYNQSIGGLPEIERRNREKGSLLYGCIDKHAGFYRSTVTEKSHRSFMNVTFKLPSEALDDTFVKGATKAGMVGLKGYRTVGGVRVSTYNAVSVEDVRTLVSFMEEFVRTNG